MVFLKTILKVYVYNHITVKESQQIETITKFHNCKACSTAEATSWFGGGGEVVKLSSLYGITCPCA
jgi:hypothetical protein